MATVTIREVPVDFPFEPYEIQKNYMEKVIECIQTETNGVLESPTGTGKTLSLLCSSLAWLQLKKAQLQAQQKVIQNDKNSLLNDLHTELEEKAGKTTTSRAFLGLPTIIYASRTHSQLSQAMQELKRTSYRHMKATVLGSREQMCIHPEVTAERDRSLAIQMCRLKVATRSCHFYNRVDRKKEDPAISDMNIIDIEDIVQLGTRHTFCPYYMTKELKQKADIVFMPYNYLLDPLARKALGVELGNNVVILDEAHNIEHVCEDSASITVKTTDITLAIDEITAVMKLTSDETLQFEDAPKDFTPDDLCTLKQTLLDFEKEMDAIDLKNSSDEGVNFPGDFMYDLLEKATITSQNVQSISTVIENIVRYLAAINEGPFARKGNGLQLFADLLRIVFAKLSPEFKDKIKRCYKVHIKIEEQKKQKPTNWLSKATSKGECRILSYWCFSPGFGMNLVMDQGVRCVILTSGTLAPLNPLISELELGFPVKLENPHIVTDKQICVKILQAGPDREPLNCNYQNRDNPKYLSSLGKSIVNLTRVIPNGLLIFFPSYPIMQKCQNQWQGDGTWAGINSIKTIYVEPKDKESFSSAMTEYYKKIEDPNLKGAVFMGVCRGKVSEGLDFADANGRGVIVIGLPYPPLKDPRVILKRRYLDVCNSRDREYLKGEEWYSLEASRAVNQAIGRVIRHRNDYGAILLLDTRFNSSRIKSQMSRWLRDHIQPVQNFGELIRDLSKFFKNAENILPAPCLKKADTTKCVQAQFDDSRIRKCGFDFSTSSYESDSPRGLPSNKRLNKDNDITGAFIKRKKITLVHNASASEKSPSTTSVEYLTMVKKALVDQTYTDFVSALNLYKNNSDFEELTNKLDGIFLSRPNLRYLIRGLEPFIRNIHKQWFQKYWEKMRL